MNNSLKIFVSMLGRMKVAVIVALIAGIAGIGIYFLGRGSAGMINGEPDITVGLEDRDNSDLSSALKSYLIDSLGMTIIEEKPENFNDMLINKDISAIIELPDGFQQTLLDGKKPEIISTTLDDYENGAYISVYIDGFMNSAAAAAKASDGNEKTFAEIISAESKTVLKTESAVISSRETEYVIAGYRMSCGFITLMMFGVCIFITLAVMDDKFYGTYNRMRASSITGLQYIAGASSAGLIISLPVSMPLTLFLLISGAEITLNPAAMIVINVLFSLFSSSLAIFLALFVKNKPGLFMSSSGIASLGSILGGAFFPIDESIGTLKFFSVLTPHYWYMNYVGGESENPIINIAILLLFAVALILASSIIFTKRSAK